MSMDHWRKQIDAIDGTMVRLLNERARCARMIGYLKRQGGLPIVDLEREQQIYSQLGGANRGPLETAALRRIYERIIDEMRLLQGYEEHPTGQGES
ncbi:chorismate mutase [candidate division KSB1 bacterium]|nr:chorismate mutase [candidate division KSB1 bacterium]